MLLYGKMPQTLSAKKALRQSRRKAIITTKTKVAYKKALREAQKKKSKASVAKAFSALDQAAKKQVIHKKRASRLKSRLSKLVKEKTPKVKKRKKTSKKA